MNLRQDSAALNDWPQRLEVMKMSHERMCIAVQTGEFLIALSCDQWLPERPCHDAKILLRHYLSKKDIVLDGPMGPGITVLGPVFSSTIKDVLMARYCIKSPNVMRGRDSHGKGYELSGAACG